MNQRNGNGESTAIVEFQQRQEALGTVDVASARQIAEVQAAMVVAKRFPRNHADAYARIMTACKRPALAEEAIYSFPRGGSKIEGPTIRLAEALAQNWGNMDFGIIELEQRDGESSMMSYAVDLETNTRQTKIFTVRHERKARGQIDRLTDPRDIYEMTANLGARRLRKCILGIIPGDVVDAAVAECNRTMRQGSDEPIQDRARKMVAAFAELGVTRVQLEQRLGHKLESISEAELVGFKKIYVSLKDDASAPSQWFKPMPPDGSDGPELTPDDIKPSGGQKADEQGAQGQDGGNERDELKAEAIKLGLVDKSCSWRVERLREAVVREHDRLEAEKAKGIHADEPPPDYPDNTEPMDVG
jgi:hypothetical protein